MANVIILAFKELEDFFSKLVLKYNNGAQIWCVTQERGVLSVGYNQQTFLLKAHSI